MTGWRLGYAAAPEKALAKAIESIQSHSTSNPVSFTQPGGVAALDKGDADAEKMRVVFEKRRDLFIEKLKAVKTFKPFKPSGAFYLFVDIRATGLSAFDVAKKLLDEVHVAVIPCEPFGSSHHIRMSYATSEKDIEAAVQRIAKLF